ncbi:MAG: head-tail connector protein [Burkholderiales bacterium]|nr:head-tail connector protein [Burkholderiales bacterium]
MAADGYNGNDSRADEILRVQGDLEAQRSTWESHWSEVAERVLPRMDQFKGPRTPGEKHQERIFDSTAPLALERFAAAMESYLVPRTQQWHRLRPVDDDLGDDHEVRVYLDQVTDILFGSRYSPRANFASQTYETFLSLGAFGTGALFIDDAVGYGLRYKSVPLSGLYIAENAVGEIDYVHRKYKLSARAAMQQFGEDSLPEKIRDAASKTPFREFEFIHCVKPNAERDERRADYRGMAWASQHVSLEGRALVRVAGYRAKPYAVSRYVTSPCEVYGRGPAMTVLPDIKMVNEMSKTILRAGQKAVDPPLLLADDGLLAGFSLRPGALNYNTMSPSGQPLVQSLESKAQMGIGAELLEDRRRAINDAFLITLFQILIETPRMTATEAMLRAQEKGALLAPTMGRQQSEMLGPLIEREIDILAAAGMLPEMPDALAERGGNFAIVYESPLTRVQRAEEGVGIMRTFESITPLAQIDPSIMDIFILDETVRELADINGLEAKLMRSRSEMEALKAKRAQQEQAAALLQAAPVLGKTAKDLAQAEAIGASAPRRAIPGAA